MVVLVMHTAGLDREDGVWCVRGSQLICKLQCMQRWKPYVFPCTI